MKWKNLLLALFCVSLLAGNVLAEGKPKKKTVKSDDQVLALIEDITKDVDDADTRLGKVEVRLTALDTRVKTVEEKQEGSLTALRGIRATQDEQLKQVASLREELAASNAKADTLQVKTQQLASEAAQANQLAANALAHAQAADRAAQPKGPGKLLALLFPRMLGHH